MAKAHTSRKPTTVARGVRHKSGVIGIVVYFDPETFAQVRARAVTRGTSFAQQVRELVEFGLIDAVELADA
jgi:uncharacterized protein (DUF2141 family)